MFPLAVGLLYMQMVRLFEGLNKEWTFHVSAASPARLLNRTPQTASTGVSPSANLTLTFDQAMSRGTGSCKSIKETRYLKR